MHAYYISLIAITAVAGRPPLPAVADHIVGILAIVLTVIGCLGRVWCSAFIAGYKERWLITDGPYSVCRHPLYVFSFIGGIGIGLTTRSIAITLFTMLLLGTLFTLAARAEDQLLANTHQRAFEEYEKRTPAWWPRWASYRVAPTVEMRPTIFRKAFMDATAFILLYALIDTARALREAGAFPSLLHLP